MAAAILRSSGTLGRRLINVARLGCSFSSGAITKLGASGPIPRPLASVAGPHHSSYNLIRLFGSSVKNLPQFFDPDIEAATKDLLACNWEQIPESVIAEATKAVGKETSDSSGKEVLKNAFRAAEACQEFSGTLISLRMALDDLSGLAGDAVGPLPDYVLGAVKAVWERYMTYLDSFGPEEGYLRKKVETELGTKMIHLKMRCSGLGSEWGKISLVGTSGLSGSFVELRS